MKKIYILIAAVVLTTGTAFGQLSCSTAVQISSSSNCLYNSHIISGSEYWLKFTVANSTNVNIEVITTKFSINSPHVHGIFLYDSCGNPVAIASDELAFFSDADRLTIDLDASNLIIGSTYFIKLVRQASGSVQCDKIDCFPVVSPAAFDICIEEVDVFIPPDLQLESPAISHAYYQQRGQLLHTDGTPASEVKMYTLHTNPAVFIGEDFVSFVQASNDTMPATLDTMHRVDMKLVGMELTPRVFKTERIPGVINHYLPHVPKGITGTKGFSRAVNNDVYPKIDMQYYSNSEGMKFYFVVRPGGDADQVVMKYSGADNVSVTGSNGLMIETPLGDIEFERAHVYRIHPTNNSITVMPASGDFVDLGNNQFKFNVQNYPANWTLVIAVDRGHSLPPNPSVNNSWSAYLRGLSDDVGYDLVTGAFGDVFITGSTKSLDFPDTLGLQTWAGDKDVFIGRFNPLAERVWLSYYGGGNTDEGLSIAHGVLGNLYVTGYTSSWDFPTTDPGGGAYYQNLKAGGRDAFIIQLDTASGTPSWATFFGGTGNESGYSIATDALDRIYITGRTASTVFTDNPCGVAGNNGFPLCQPSPTAYYQDWHNGGNFDGFLAMFEADGQLYWSTLFGGQGFDQPYELAIEKNNHIVYIAGYTASDNTGANNAAPCVAYNKFPLCNPGGNAYYQNTHGVTFSGIAKDGFLLKFNLAHQLMWGSYFGTRRSVISDIAVNSTGDVYITGYADPQSISLTCIPVSSGNFPKCDPGGVSYSQLIGGNRDAFIARFNSSGEMIWSSLYGGSTNEASEANGVFRLTGGQAIAIDANDNVYISGFSTLEPSNYLNDFPVLSFPGYYYQSQNASSSMAAADAYVVCFDPSNKRLWATLYGGDTANSSLGAPYDGSEVGLSLATYQSDRLYMTGITVSGTFPLACPPTGNPPWCQGPDIANPQWYDAYIVRFDIATLTGTEENKPTAAGLLIYPNPAAKEITLEFHLTEKQNVEIRLYSILGGLIYKEIIDNVSGKHTHSIDVSGYANGIYLVKIKAGEQNYSRRVVKEQ